MSKHKLSSTASEMDTSASNLEQSVFSDQEGEIEKKSKKKKKPAAKQRKIEEFASCKEQDNGESGKQAKSPKPVDAKKTDDKKLDEINKKLENVLTKNDSIFIKDIIKSTINQMKESLLAPVIKRVEILEGELHEKCIESTQLKQKLEEKEQEITSLMEENKALKSKLKMETKAREKDVNDIEQYSRRNNIRINGIPDDSNKQQSGTTIDLVVKTLREKSNINITPDDIDVAHRLGKWKGGEHRPVIVKLVRRQTKINIMKVRKSLKEESIFVSEDLTKLNQEVLSSLRLKDPDGVEKCWSFEGRIYALFKNETQPCELKYQDYSFWLEKPWPEKKKKQSVSKSH